MSHCSGGFGPLFFTHPENCPMSLQPHHELQVTLVTKALPQMTREELEKYTISLLRYVYACKEETLKIIGERIGEDRSELANIKLPEL